MFEDMGRTIRGRGNIQTRAGHGRGMARVSPSAVIQQSGLGDKTRVGRNRGQERGNATVSLPVEEGQESSLGDQPAAGHEQGRDQGQGNPTVGVPAEDIVVGDHQQQLDDATTTRPSIVFVRPRKLRRTEVVLDPHGRAKCYPSTDMYD